MADINVERKETSIWPWIIGLLVLLLLAWLLFSLLDDDDADVATAPVVEEPAITPAPVTPTQTAMGPTCISEIGPDPATAMGRSLNDCQVTVTEVPSDRGFWIEENGTRMFVIINDQPAEEPKDINPGQTLRLTQATVYEDVANVPGTVDPDTRNIVQQEDYFLNVDEENIAIVEGGTPQPGTDPAATVGEGTM